MQYRLLRAVTWRYVSSPCSGSVPLSCFYGGQVLDGFRIIAQLAPASSNNTDFVWFALYVFVACTRFMNHFEEITEPQFNTDYSVSVLKIIDLLDCIMDDEECTGTYQQAVTNNKTECIIKARYKCVHLCPSRYTDRGKVPYLLCHLRAYTENKAGLSQTFHFQNFLIFYEMCKSNYYA